MTITSIRGRAAAYTLAALLALTACGSSPQPAAQPIATNIPSSVETSPTPAELEATAATIEASPTTAKPATKPTPTKTRTTAPSRKPAPKATTVKPKPTTAKPPSGQQGVHPGAFCTPVGAIGYTSKGTKMRCTKKDGDIRARWRAA
ncbi:hypothetical protein [Micromonospora tulbaghiae]|uniref:hypothetical protein n=1 Tax=Micromonospora tulbaghiae TaxID=479978 RepID=UPI0033F83A9C